MRHRGSAVRCSSRVRRIPTPQIEFRDRTSLSPISNPRRASPFRITKLFRVRRALFPRFVSGLSRSWNGIETTLPGRCRVVGRDEPANAVLAAAAPITTLSLTTTATTGRMPLCCRRRAPSDRLAASRVECDQVRVERAMNTVHRYRGPRFSRDPQQTTSVVSLCSGKPNTRPGQRHAITRSPLRQST